MEVIKEFLDFFLHLDVHLNEWVANYKSWTYAILFLIIFVETGLVVMPFLPGDSLLFACGALAATEGSELNVFVLFIVLFVAAVLGDTVNYAIGNYIGPKVFSRDYRFIKREHLLKTQAFYEKHGGKTIIIARFMPFIRTFAPFVAGVGTMRYGKFISFNIVGGFLWIAGFLTVGYLFGNLETVKHNFTYVIFGIIFLSILPPIIEYLRTRKLATK
ncbi:MAG: DedA family protein [Chitinophagales bacterium]|nr:DedA family protein [Chitinophagales bacterium]